MYIGRGLRRSFDELEETLVTIGVYRVYSITRVNMYTRYIGVYRVYSMTRVNMGTQDI